jgi:hypothetical protein
MQEQNSQGVFDEVQYTVSLRIQNGIYGYQITAINIYSVWTNHRLYNPLAPCI